MSRSRSLAPVFLALVLLAPRAAGAEPFKYPEDRHGKGELKYRNGLPVLTVEGSPEEIGTQIGVLTGAATKRLSGTLKEYLKAAGLTKAWPLLVKAGHALFKNFPEAHRREVRALAKASGVDLELFVVANTISDLKQVAGCSTLTVEPGRSATGAPLFGRNFDFLPAGNLHEYSLVIVYRPAGKRAFATVSFPGLLVGGSAINDAGLAFGANEVTEAADDSERFNPRGTPALVLFRRLLEECADVAAAEKLLRPLPRTGMANLVVCDRKGGAVFEATTKTVAVRRPERGLCSCTNHFRVKGLATATACRRFEALEKARDLPKIGLADVAKRLHEANQGEFTLQTMIFEPAALRLHLSLGKGPTSARPLKALELGPLFKKGRD
jgi:hypothetical protein